MGCDVFDRAGWVSDSQRKMYQELMWLSDVSGSSHKELESMRLMDYDQLLIYHSLKHWEMKRRIEKDKNK